MSLPRFWPGGIQAAVTVTVNFDGESVDQHAASLPLWGRYSYGRYGAQLGAERLLDVLQRFGVTATFFVGGWDAERYPSLVQQIVAAGHEVAGYGYRHENFSTLSLDEQRSALEQSEAALERVAGTRPVGFRAPEGLMSTETRTVLAERGYRYDSTYCDDDLPYTISGHNGARLVELPVHDPCTDKLYYVRNRMPWIVQNAFHAEFDAAYEEGALFNLALHPRGDYGSGRAVRLPAVESLLQSVREHPNVWVATCREVADYVLTQPAGVTTEQPA